MYFVYIIFGFVVVVLIISFAQTHQRLKIICFVLFIENEPVCHLNKFGRSPSLYTRLHTSGDKTNVQFIVGKHFDVKIEEFAWSKGISWQLQGMGIQCHLSYEEFKEETHQYENLIFAMSRDDVLTLEDAGVLVIPPLYSKVVASSIEKVLNNIWDELNGVVVCNYESIDNLSFLHLNVEEVKKEIRIENIPDQGNRFLWFHPKGLIINVRITDEEDKNCVNRELTNSRDDIKLFYYLNQEQVKKQNMFVTFLIIAPRVTKQTIAEICKDCMDHVITKESLVEEKPIETFIKFILSNYRKNYLQHKSVICAFRQTIAKLVAFMAATNTRTQPYLPLLGGSPSDKLSSLMLNPNQINILRSNSCGKIVKGCYGSGKTILGRIMFRSYANRALEFSPKIVHLYYIVWDSWSLCHLFNKDCEREFIENMKALCKTLHFHIISLNEVLEILKIRTEVSLPHLLLLLSKHHHNEIVLSVIDEYQPRNAKELNDLRKLKSVSAMILVQPMRIFTEWEDLDNDYDNLEVENSDDINDDCGDLCDMKIFHLKEAMRTTSEVSHILNTAQEVIEKEPTMYVQPTIINEHNVDVIANASKNAGNIDHAENRRKDMVKFSFGLEYLKQKWWERKKNDQEIRLQCRYQRFDHLGHGFHENRLPQLYEWPVRYNKVLVDGIHVAAAINLNAILLKLQEISPCESITILCTNKFKLDIASKVINIFSMGHSKMMAKKLQMSSIISLNQKRIIKYAPFLSNKFYPPSNEDKEEIYQCLGRNQDYILLTDIRGYRGLETTNLIVLIDKNEHQGRQFLAECVSRCNSNNLFLISVTKDIQYNNENQTVQHIINCWKDEETVDLQQLTVSENEHTNWHKLVGSFIEQTAEVYKDDAQDVDWNR